MLRVGTLLAALLLLGGARAHAACDPAPGPNGYNVREAPYSAAGDGTSDDTARIQAAINDAEACSNSAPGVGPLGAQVYFPAGVYLVSSTLTVKFHGVSLAGQGAHTTTIKRAPGFTAGDTIRIALPDQPTLMAGNNVSNLQLLAAGPTSSGAHLNLVNCQRATVTNVALEEQFGGLRLEGGATLAFTNLNIFTDKHFGAVQPGSYLVRLDPSGNPSVKNPTDITFMGGNWRSTTGQARVQYGLRVHSSDAVYFTNVHILGGARADVLIEPTSRDSQVSGLRFNNCWFDEPGPAALAAVVIQGQVTPPAYGLFSFNACMFWGGGGVPGRLSKANRGVVINGPSVKGVSITDSTIHGFGAHGVHLVAGSSVLLSGNQISNNNHNAEFGAGIMVEPGVSDFQILNNVIGPNLASFTTRHTYGILVAPGASNRYSISGNVVLNWLPGGAAISDGGAGPTKLVGANLF